MINKSRRGGKLYILYQYQSGCITVLQYSYKIYLLYICYMYLLHVFVIYLLYSYAAVYRIV